jgi:hypothetical protein
MLQQHCWFTGSCLFFASPLISYLHVVVVLACLCCCSLHVWGYVIAIGTASFLVEWLLLASFFAECYLLLFDSTLQGSGPTPAFGPFGAS